MTTKEQTMTPTLRELLANEPDDFLPELRTWLHHHPEDLEDASPSFRAAAGETAADDAESDGEEMSGCAHGVLTSDVDPALTCGNVRAPDSQSEGAEERGEQRTTCAPRYSTDPDQSLRDLKRRTRRDLAAEVRRLRRECAKTRRKLRDAEERLSEVEEARRG